MHARYLAYAGFFAVGTYFVCGSQLKATCSLTVVALYARGRGRQEPPRKRICIMNEPGQPTGEGSFEMRKEAPCRASACLERASEERFLRNKGGPPGRNQSPLAGGQRRGGETMNSFPPSRQRWVSKLVERVRNKTNAYPFT